MFEAICVRMNSRRRPLLLYIFKLYAPIYVLFWFIRFASGSIVLLKHLHTHFVQPQRVNIVFLKIFRIIIYSLCILGEEESITKCNGCWSNWSNPRNSHMQMQYICRFIWQGESALICFSTFYFKLSLIVICLPQSVKHQKYTNIMYKIDYHRERI